MVKQCGELRYTDPLDKLRGTQAYRRGPSPRERKAEQRRLDTPMPSWEDIDTRIGQWLEVERQKFEQMLAARLEEERDLWREVTAGVLAKMRNDVEQRPGPQGPPGPAGKLPSIREWKSGQVAYEDQVFTYNGASFQALRDTGQEPGGSDWVQIARAGRDGILPHLCGTYDASAVYKKFDICALNGSSFIARKDDPGQCPGSGWQLHASAGRAGGRGERGEQGSRGPAGERGPKGMPGASIVGWHIDPANYAAIPLMSDGKHGPALELREIFKQFVVDAR
jgi:hypothetical protein